MATTTHIKWSADLPPCPQKWTESYVDNLIRSKNELGIPRVRKRFTRNVRTFQFSYTLPKEFYQAWIDFYEGTLGHGVAAFEYIHPYTQEVLLMRLNAVPKPQLDYKVFRIQLTATEVVA